MPKKKNETQEVIEKIFDYTLEDIMGERFGSYSKYIIQERAIPDARDGLKPVQRRILYSMHKEKNTYDKGYRKSAKTVGDVIGNYHPHGDTSIYDAMVRMSQPWKTRLPYIDMHGNNGSIDGDSPAAYRYTEARLSKISNEMLRDIDKDTVEFAPNFDDTTLEPTVLPARFPALLVYGAMGISAGYATNIPPHNLGEVIDATIHRIDNPNCSLDTLMKYVKGPDFPTGGIIEGLDGIRAAYETGRGKIVVKCRYTIEESKSGKSIIITEIPFEVNKALMVKKIDDIRIDKKIDGISEVRDESAADVRVVIDLKKNANVDLIINYSSLSPVSGKFQDESGKYECKYEVTTNSGGLKCDLNEPNHFKDLNGDGKLDSGPNGEDCCEKVADEFGEKSEVYQELVDKGWCPVDPDGDNPGDSCVYPDDLETSDIITKQKCCSMVLTDPSLSIEERVDHYNKYCVGDPYCPQDCEDGVCHYSPMTQDLRNCIASGKSYNECKIDNCPAGGSIVIYRPISLLTDESFPGVEKLDRIWSNNNWYYYSNWAYRGGTSQDRDYYAEKYITNNRGVKEYEIYDMDPMYVIDLDADTIGAIRKYNDTNSYDDFNLTCKNDRQCRSDFVKDYATGCGVNDDWYACKGISASRGD